MKSFALLLVVVTSFSCSTIFNRQPATAVSQKPRHVIITVHGLSGNALTWGSFGPITENYLTQIDPNYDVQVSNFLYPTGQSEKLNTFDFANALNSHIESLFRDRPLEPQDRISLVGHSQGGIVSYIWFFSRILNDQLDQKYIKQVDTIITLGTPFWGSKLATILTDKNYPNIVPLLNIMAETPITHRELEDMSYGSDSLHTFRQLAIKMDTDPNLENRLRALPVRLINILGVLPKNQDDIFANRNANAVSKFGRKIIGAIYNMFDYKKDNGVSRVESDIAVPIPSGRWNFIYSKPHQVAEGQNLIASSEFHHFNNLVDRNRSKFLFTESVHLPFDNDNTLSMAYINKTCAKPETCEHPT
jgi:pimeloyl-ACP methyl ester carboxylesterase